MAENTDRMTLRHSMRKLAREGNATIQIWLRKQLLAQRDSTDNQLGGERPIDK